MPVASPLCPHKPQLNALPHRTEQALAPVWRRQPHPRKRRWPCPCSAPSGSGSARVCPTTPGCAPAPAPHGMPCTWGAPTTWLVADVAGPMAVGLQLHHSRRACLVSRSIPAPELIVHGLQVFFCFIVSLFSGVSQAASSAMLCAVPGSASSPSDAHLRGCTCSGRLSPLFKHDSTPEYCSLR